MTERESLPRLSGIAVLDTLEELIQETAEQANKAADAVPWAFDKIGAGTGVGIRLQALKDAKAAVLTLLLKDMEAVASASS